MTLPGAFVPIDVDLSPRLRFVNLLPATLFVGTVLGLLLSGAPYDAPNVGLLVENGGRYGWVGAAALTAVSLVAALLLQPLELASIRLLEGYWSQLGPLVGVARLGHWLQLRRKSRLLWVQANLPDLAGQARLRLMQFPAEWPLLPTTLGNRLRAHEERAGWPYRLDAFEVWRRMYFVMPPDALQKIQESRNQLDIAARLAITFALSTVAAAGLLVRHPPWLLLPATLAVLAWLSYRSAIAAATGYGRLMTAAIDIYRPVLLRALGVEAPRDTDQERAIFARLAQAWRRASPKAPPVIRYATADGDTGVPDRPGTP